MTSSFTTDVLIVGGGVIGLSIARALRRGGAGSITILERGKTGREASFAAAGMLAPQAESDTADDFFRLCVKSNDLYDDLAGELYDETGIDIELDSSGTLYLAFDSEELEELNSRYEWQSGAGLKVEKLSPKDTLLAEPRLSRDLCGSLFFPRDRQVENRLLLKALEGFANQNDIVVEEGVEVIAFGESENGIPFATCSDGSRYESASLVLAAGAWTSKIEGIGTNPGIPEISPVRGQMISLEGGDVPLTKVVYSKRGYVVPRKRGNIVAGSTTERVGFEDHTTEQGIAEIRRNAIEIADGLRSASILDSWSGLRPFPESGRLFVGRVPGRDNVFAAAGHYRNGILLAPVTANAIADMVLGNQSDPAIQSFGAESAAAGAMN